MCIQVLQDTPFPGWCRKTYFMVDGGKVTYYYPPKPDPEEAAKVKEGVVKEEEEGVKEEEVKVKKEDAAEVKEEDGEAADGEFMIERVVAKRSAKGVIEYKCRWAGYSAADDTWEPLANLEGAQNDPG